MSSGYERYINKVIIIIMCFARSTIPEEKWGTTRSLHREPPHDQEGARVPSFGDIPLMFVTVKDGSSIFTEGQL